jgi:hypothetical protein
MDNAQNKGGRVVSTDESVGEFLASLEKEKADRKLR